jgi:hypothetical protein
MPVGLLRRSCSHWKMSATEIAITERETMMQPSCRQTVFVGEPVSTGTVRSNNIPLVHLLFFICLTLSFLETLPRLAVMADRV